MVFVCPGELNLHLIDAVKLIDGDFDSRTTSMQTLLCEGMLKYATEYETGYNGKRRLYSRVVYPAVRADALKIYWADTQVSITQYLHDRETNLPSVPVKLLVGNVQRHVTVHVDGFEVRTATSFNIHQDLGEKLLLLAEYYTEKMDLDLAKTHKIIRIRKSYGPEAVDGDTVLLEYRFYRSEGEHTYLTDLLEDSKVSPGPYGYDFELELDCQVY